MKRKETQPENFTISSILFSVDSSSSLPNGECEENPAVGSSILLSLDSSSSLPKGMGNAKKIPQSGSSIFLTLFVFLPAKKYGECEENPAVRQQYFILTGFVFLPAKKYGEWEENPAVRQESDDPTSCHRGRRDGRFLDPSCTCLDCRQMASDTPRRSSYSCLYLCPVFHFGIS